MLPKNRKDAELCGVPTRHKRRYGRWPRLPFTDVQWGPDKGPNKKSMPQIHHVHMHPGADITLSEFHFVDTDPSRKKQVWESACGMVLIRNEYV